MQDRKERRAKELKAEIRRSKVLYVDDSVLSRKYVQLKAIENNYVEQGLLSSQAEKENKRYLEKINKINKENRKIQQEVWSFYNAEFMHFYSLYTIKIKLDLARKKSPTLLQRGSHHAYGFFTRHNIFKDEKFTFGTSILGFVSQYFQDGNLARFMGLSKCLPEMMPVDIADYAQALNTTATSVLPEVNEPSPSVCVESNWWRVQIISLLSAGVSFLIYLGMCAKLGSHFETSPAKRSERFKNESEEFKKFEKKLGNRLKELRKPRNALVAEIKQVDSYLEVMAKKRFAKEKKMEGFWQRREERDARIASVAPPAEPAFYGVDLDVSWPQPAPTHSVGVEHDEPAPFVSAFQGIKRS